MIAEAYGLSVVVALAALTFGVLRAAALRPTVLLALGIVGVFCVGYAAGHLTQPPAGWNRAGQVRAPAQWAGSAVGETVSVAPPGVDRGLIIKTGGSVSVDIFDAASAGVLKNRETVEMNKGTMLKIAGWAADSQAEGPCRALYLTFGKVRFDVPYGLPRTDVAAYFHKPSYTATGYGALIPTSGFSKGSYVVKVECLSADGKTLFVLNRLRTVVIK
jgi:hypothetical protein